MIFCPSVLKVAGHSHLPDHNSSVVSKNASLMLCPRLMMSQTPWTFVESVCLKKSRYFTTTRRSERLMHVFSIVI
jgi:hypothetical protein